MVALWTHLANVIAYLDSMIQPAAPEAAVVAVATTAAMVATAMETAVQVRL
jgi:hypothetical protein